MFRRQLYVYYEIQGRNQCWGQRTHPFYVVVGVTRVEEVGEGQRGNSIQKGKKHHRKGRQRRDSHVERREGIGRVE